jgi:hypothetical protein
MGSFNLAEPSTRFNNHVPKMGKCTFEVSENDLNKKHNLHGCSIDWFIVWIVDDLPGEKNEHRPIAIGQ